MKKSSSNIIIVVLVLIVLYLIWRGCSQSENYDPDVITIDKNARLLVAMSQIFSSPVYEQEVQNLKNSQGWHSDQDKMKALQCGADWIRSNPDSVFDTLSRPNSRASFPNTPVGQAISKCGIR